jgi:hypothetical protein
LRQVIILQVYGVWRRTGTLAVIAGLAALAGVLMLELCPQPDPKCTHDFAQRALLVGRLRSSDANGDGTSLPDEFPAVSSFHHAFAEYRASNYVIPNEERLMDALWGLSEIPEYVTGVNATVSIWTFVTVALTALVLFVLVRGFYPTSRAVAI